MAFSIAVSVQHMSKSLSTIQTYTTPKDGGRLHGVFHRCVGSTHVQEFNNTLCLNVYNPGAVDCSPHFFVASSISASFYSLPSIFAFPFLFPLYSLYTSIKYIHTYNIYHIIEKLNIIETNETPNHHTSECSSSKSYRVTIARLRVSATNPS